MYQESCRDAEGQKNIQIHSFLFIAISELSVVLFNLQHIFQLWLTNLFVVRENAVSAVGNTQAITQFFVGGKGRVGKGGFPDVYVSYLWYVEKLALVWFDKLTTKEWPQLLKQTNITIIIEKISTYYVDVLHNTFVWHRVPCNVHVKVIVLLTITYNHDCHRHKS